MTTAGEEQCFIKCILEVILREKLRKEIKLTEYEDGVILLDDYADKSCIFRHHFSECICEKSRGLMLPKS